MRYESHFNSEGSLSFVLLIALAFVWGCDDKAKSTNDGAGKTPSVDDGAGETPGLTKLSFSKLALLSCPCSEADAKAAQKKAADVLGLPEVVKLELSEKVQMEFVLIPPGSFSFSEGDELQHQSEKKYRIEKPFYIGAYEVTYEQFFVFASLDKTGGVEREIANPLLPVELDAFRECERLLTSARERLDLSVRLPTEVEWEYACRAGTKGPYGQLKVKREGLGNFVEWNKADDHYDPKYGPSSNLKLTKGGQFPPNTWGIYDALGNVKEICSDTHKELSHGTGVVAHVILMKGGDVSVSKGYFERYHTAAPSFGPYSGLRLVLDIDDHLVERLRPAPSEKTSRTDKPD